MKLIINLSEEQEEVVKRMALETTCDLCELIDCSEVEYCKDCPLFFVNQNANIELIEDD